MSSHLVLIAENEAGLASVLTAYFERAGFRAVSTNNGQSALDLHDALRPDLLALDVRLPALDGFEVLLRVRQRASTPVLVTSSINEDAEKLAALRMGADDYVVKPFNPAEIVARAQAILRRNCGRVDKVARHGPIEVDAAALATYVNSDGDRTSLDLTLTEFRLLEYMMRDPRRAYSRSMLVDACMPESKALDRTVDSHICNLRRKLARAGLPAMLPNIRGIGYRLGKAA